MRSMMVVSTALAAAVLVFSSAALAGAMHPELAARLSGMGEHGIVNLQSHMTAARLCWTFDVPTRGITGATIRDAHGMIMAHLGMHYTAKGCDGEPRQALRLIESKPGAYQVWVATMGHPGELRGRLFAGMAHM